MQTRSPSHFSLFCGLVLALGAVSGCRLIDPEQDERPVLLRPVGNSPQSLVSDTLARTPDGCAAIHFAITASTISAAYPDPASCGSGVVLRSTGGLFLERDSTHWRLSLRVAWLNKTGTAMTGSRRLILPVDSGLVLLPIASYGVDPTPVNATGVIGSAAYWDVGGGTTASGSTGLDTLIVLDIPVGTEQLLLRMTGDSLALPVGRPPVPNGWWAPTDPTLAVANTDAEGETKVYLNFLAVRFSPTATAEQVRAALRSQEAVIVGGRSGGLLGVPSYLIQIPNPGSFDALKAVIVALAAEPGVSRIGKQYYGSTMVPRSRFPVDDPSLRRWSWTDPAVTVLAAWRAIDAPSAWACENGTYGTSVTVGVLDVSLNSSFDDLLPQSTIHVTPAVDAIDSSLIGTSSTAKAIRSHGAAVASILMAKGDNGSGVAGGVWGANAVFYALASGHFTTVDNAAYFEETIGPNLLQVANPRILVSSTPLHGDSTLRLAYANAIGGWLAADAKHLFVYALPSSGSTSASSVAAGSVSGVMTTDIAVAQLSQTYPGQVLVVTASDPALGTLTGGTWTGIPILAAPGVDVLMLADSADFSGGRRLGSGTSYAAPMVAGAAAQLMNMAPTLTADSVIYYLVEGAKAPRFDALQNADVTPSPLAGSSMYQLNAYQSLRLYSLTHQTAPICGLEVSLSASDEVTIHRPTPTTISLSGINAGQVSVAPGGRLLAVGGWNPETEESIVKEFRLQGGTWVNTRTIAGVDERLYLERDTLDLTLVCPTGGCGPNLTVHRADGSSQSRNLPEISAAVEAGAYVNISAFAASPGGDWISYESRGFWDNTDTSFVKQVVYNIGTQASATFRRKVSHYAADPWNQGVTVYDSGGLYSMWARTGANLVTASYWRATYWPVVGWPQQADGKIRFLSIDLRSGSPSSGGVVTIDGFLPSYPGYFSHDDRVISHVEADWDWSADHLVRRPANSLSTVLHTTSWSWADRLRGYFPLGQLREESGQESIAKYAPPLSHNTTRDLKEYRSRWRLKRPTHVLAD